MRPDVALGGERTQRRPARIAAVTVACCVVAAAAIGSVAAVRQFAATAARSLTPDGGGCPMDGTRMVAPMEIHLQLGLQAHRNFVSFPARYGPQALFILCVDGRMWGSRPHAIENGVARYDISTRWVVAQWLAGKLDHFEDPDTWRLFSIYCPPDALVFDLGDGRTFTQCE